MRRRKIEDLRPPDWFPTIDQVERYFSPGMRYPYYKVQLAKYVASLLPLGQPLRIADIGCGDARLAGFIQRHRSHTRFVGFETLARPARDPAVEVVLFDGGTLPCADNSFDIALLCDVIHHARNQERLLSEAARISRQGIIVKDHVFGNSLERYQLLILDMLGNRRFGVEVIGRYLDLQGWQALLSPTHLQVDFFPSLPLRSGILGLVFGNRLEILFSLTGR
ncbi:MAG: class I SAM-dependent methyltransferase [Acidobacteria bacterium]|nr:class I SAM-dependent methyltransferase [Acidobacteriota bacterium]